MYGSPNCLACGSANDADARFCVACGASLELRCAACGAVHAPADRFCKACGAPLAAPAVPASAESHVELRPVSVLFVDLVGYTALSEGRDPEDIRELLSRYFEIARTIADRYGGVVEKFIGDAVMIVWGTPAAREDDAERAVRAGLDLLDAVVAFGEEAGTPALRARAGVATGQAASVDNPGERLVVGDRVNTAARIQTTAPPGALYVDELTRQGTSAAIVYEDAGRHTVKGKAEPLQLWLAVRVVAGVAGAQREEGLEAPFVGRHSEFRLVKDLFHASAERRSARLVLIAGAPGVGKSRLRREFEHYSDGLAEDVLWHTGRCLAYGDGVVYWALSEMVRQRLGIPSDTPAEEAERKLELGLERWILEPAEREFLMPRLGVLIGSADTGLDRKDLFAGWRLFFERLSEEAPVVLAFEDVHRADEGLLDFIEHLATWSSDRPIFILCLGRPEVVERRGDWATSRPGFTPIFLEPLYEAAVRELLDGLVAELPPELRDTIVERAEGIPLYALETVRTLVDRDALAPGSDGRLRVAGEPGELSVPATLSSLLTSRLDALPGPEQHLVRDLAVWGGSFTRSSAAALCELPEEQIDALLDSLVRKQILTVRTDPLSPDRGQYLFAQNLLRAVAYDMLARHERKSRHLAAARHLRGVFPNDGEDVAEVVAAHQLDAYRAAAGDPDEDDLRHDALLALRRAARRAEAVGGPEAAQRAYGTALELAGDPEERFELTEAAAEMSLRAGRYEQAIELFEEVARAHAAAGRDRDAARIAGRVGLALRYLGRAGEAIERMREALAILGADVLDPEVAALNLQLGTALVFAGQGEESADALERALVIAEALELPAVLSGALCSSSVRLGFEGRHVQEMALYRAAIEVGEQHGISHELMRARSNLAERLVETDDADAATAVEAALAAARRLGDRGFESVAAGNLMARYLLTGQWELMDRLAEELLANAGERGADGGYLHARMLLLCALRGDVAGARGHLDGMIDWRTTEDVEDRLLYLAGCATLAYAEGRLHEALEGSYEVMGGAGHVGLEHMSVRQVWPLAVDAALALERLDDVERLVELMAGEPPGRVTPLMRAILALTRGRLGTARRDETAEEHLLAAIDVFTALGYPYWLGRATAAHADWLAEAGREEEAAAQRGAAEALLEPLGAQWPQARVGDASAPPAVG